MSTNQDTRSPGRILFRIDASRCQLSVGDTVAPETAIGENPDTGAGVVAGCHGQVEAITFCAADHTLIVTVRRRDSDRHVL
ncbi:MAG: hypothetical protein ACOYZ7_06230 [Chloroflexota bacterium]